MNSIFPGQNEPVDGKALEDYSDQNLSPDFIGLTIVDYLYLIESNRGGLYKIGITSDPERRMRELQPRQVLALVEVYDARSIEKSLHAEYAHARLAGTEYFELAEDEVAELISTLKTDLAAVSTSFPLVPSTVKQGIEFALEYQKRHSKFWIISEELVVHKMQEDLDPLDMTKLELRYEEAFEDLHEYVDACWSFRSFAYNGSIDGVLKAIQLICAYHQYRIEKGIDEPGDDLEAREWNEDIVRVQEWKESGLSPTEMMKRTSEIHTQRTNKTLLRLDELISNQADYADNTSLVSDKISPSLTRKPKAGIRLTSSDSSIRRRANALRRWRQKDSG